MSLAAAREFFDVAIIVPLEEELLSVMEVFPSVENRSTATSYRHRVDVGEANVKCLVVQQARMGKMAANLAVVEVTNTFEVGLLVCLGIAGSLSADMNLADVCYTGTISDVHDNSKTGDAPNGGLTLKFSPTHFDTPIELTTAFNFVRTQPEMRTMYIDWQNDRCAIAEALLPNPIAGRRQKLRAIRTPETMCGTIVCGSVSKSQVYNDALADIDRKVLAIETESGGVFAAARNLGVPAITIRAISDYADANKTALENETAGKIRSFAAGNAATFLKLQFQNPFFLNILERNRQRQNSSLALTGDAEHTEGRSLSNLLDEIKVHIDQRLRELCPEYKLQSSGYKLPLPRVQRRETSRTIDTKTRSPAFEIRSVIETQKIVMLDLPRSYPDQALPWMIAHDLLTSEIAGRQVVPLVIDGDRLGPPRSGFSRSSGYHIDDIIARPGAVPVIVVDNCPLSSKTRMKFLLNEVEQYPDTHFVFIARGNGALIFSSDMGAQFRVELFDICDVSFSELAHFIECNFQMSVSEAEVIAHRISDTFKRYELRAHPSYLAAISSTTLTALINANRRSELIQLAVDSTLSFVVADDTSDVLLSRTTRIGFLQRLVHAIRVDGQMFDEPALIAFTSKFSDDFDFDISSVAFINAFVERGILHFYNLKAMISLPYIESYLLAKALREDVTAAKSYFRLSSPDFDFPTFDIYAELGPHKVIVDIVHGELDAAIASLPELDGRNHSIMTSRLVAGEGTASAKFSKVYSQLQDAIDEVIAGKSASAQKQQIIDMRNDVRSTAARTTRDEALSPEQQDSITQSLIRGLTTWSTALILLNSGAEHLQGKTKREIASKIVTLSSRLLDAWTDIHNKINFDAIRKELTSDEHISRFLEKHNLLEQNNSKETVKALIGNMVDLVGEGFISLPLATILTGICQAHQRVLARSLTQLEPHEVVEKLVHSIWLLETDPASGESRASASIRALPRAPILRGVIFNHLISTAYWNHSHISEKKLIANVANTAIQPFAQAIDPKLLVP